MAPETCDAPCFMCAGDRQTFVRAARDVHRPAGPLFRLTRCRDCGHVMQNPPPSRSELEDAYAVGYDLYRPAWSEPGWPLWKVLREITTRRRIARLRRHARGGQLLEIGCGAGDFLRRAREEGWHVRAVEFSAHTARLVGEAIGADVRAGELTADLWADVEFDTIVLWNVLEHLEDPYKTMRIVAERLRPGGAVLLSLPTRDAAEAGRVFGDDWVLLDLPRHLHFFDRSGLEKLCVDAGLHLSWYRTPALDTAWVYAMSAARALGRRRRWGATALAVATGAPAHMARSTRGRGVEAFVVMTKPFG